MGICTDVGWVQPRRFSSSVSHFPAQSVRGSFSLCSKLPIPKFGVDVCISTSITMNITALLLVSLLLPLVLNSVRSSAPGVGSAAGHAIRQERGGRFSKT